MKKFLCFVFAAILVISRIALAGGVGNCVQPIRTTTSLFGTGAAFELNYVAERANYLDNKNGPSNMEVNDLTQVYGKITIGLFDYLNIYGKIGACNYDLEFDDRWPPARMTFDLEDGIYTGTGINMLIPVTKWENFNLGVGGDIQANLFHNDVSAITKAGEGASSVDGSFYGIDGQNSLYLTCKYKYETPKIKTSFVPYVGAYHSWIVVGTVESLTYDTDSSGFVESEDFQAAYDFGSFGLLFGMDIDVAEYVNLYIEGRVGGETALTSGATVKF
jgi:hypothetical protein